jgi:hypothetical protein
MKLYKCVYCLQDKPESEFNKEHVTPQAFGMFQQNLTLHNNQVCKRCNKFFSDEMETVISEDSYEGLLRRTNGTIIFDNGRKLRHNRITITGQDDVLNGLNFQVISDNSSEEMIRLSPFPMIGLQLSENSQEYQYYTPNNFPDFSEEIGGKISGKKEQILFWNMAIDEVEKLLLKKGYSEIKKLDIKPFTDIFCKPSFNTKIDIIHDKLYNRLIAKTAFNYLVYQEGVEMALLNKFNPIRNFIRYGIDHESIKVKHCQGKLGLFSTNENCHVIGLAWGKLPYDGIYGIVSWFNEFTHIICLTDNHHNIAHSLPMSLFDNNTKTISTTNHLFCI